jgi:muconolactone delta-isomerase
MAFEQGRAKTDGRTAGTRNKVNMFDQDTIDKTKQLLSRWPVVTLKQLNGYELFPF